MNKVSNEILEAQSILEKIKGRREKIKNSILKATKCDLALQKKEDEISDYILSVKKIMLSMPDFESGDNLPKTSDLPEDWYSLEYETIWQLKRYFRGCIRRDGCENRQWCVIDVVKIFIEIFVEQNPGCVKLEQKHSRIYFYNSKTNDYTRYETPTRFRHATSKLGRFFNAFVAVYLNRINREKKGHARILHDKGTNVIAPYCAFNYWDYEDHKDDLLKPIKIYDDLKLIYLLNQSTEKFRKKFPRLYKIQNPTKIKSTNLQNTNEEK